MNGSLLKIKFCSNKNKMGEIDSTPNTFQKYRKCIEKLIQYHYEN